MPAHHEEVPMSATPKDDPAPAEGLSDDELDAVGGGGMPGVGGGHAGSPRGTGVFPNEGSVI